MQTFTKKLVSTAGAMALALSLSSGAHAQGGFAAWIQAASAAQLAALGIVSFIVVGSVVEVNDSDGVTIEVPGDDPVPVTNTVIPSTNTGT